MFCANCGNPVPDGAKFCPVCGNAMPVKAATPEPKETPVPAEPVRESADQAPDKPVNMSPIPEEPTEKKPSGKRSGGKKGKKKGRAGLIVLICLLVALAAVIALNFSVAKNLVDRTFSSPEKYYHSVEGRVADSLAGSVAEAYGNVIDTLKDAKDTSVSGSAEFELGKKLWEILEEEADVTDMDWLSSVKLDYDLTSSGDLTGANVALALNGDALISLESVLSMADQTAWVKVPELSADYVELDLEDTVDQLDYLMYSLPYSLRYPAQMLLSALGEQDSEVAETFEKVVEALPDSAQAEALITRYLGVIINSLNNVTRASSVLTAGGVSGKYTQLIVKIDEDTVIDITENVTAEMMKDKELEKYIIAVADAVGMDGDEVYDEFIEGIEDANENAEDNIRLEEDVVMTLWVDLKGGVVGRQVKHEDQKLLFAMPRKGTQVGVELSAKEDGEKLFALTGSGKVSGKSLAGSFTLNVQGTSVADIEVSGLDVLKAMKGYIKGNFVVTPSKALISEMYLPSSLESLAKKLTLNLDLDTGKDQAAIRLAVNSGSGELLVITSDAAMKDAKKLSAIKGAYTLEEWMDEVDEEDVDKLISRLEKSDLPDEITESLSEMLQYAFS